jgi:molybdopterin converting factor small subunit
MPKVNFTSNLKRFYPELETVQVSGETIANAVAQIETIYKGLTDYIIDEKGALRKHMNIFIGNNMIIDRIKLSDKLNENDEIHIIQALSGG